MADHVFWSPPVTQAPEMRDYAVRALRQGTHVAFHCHGDDRDCPGFATLGVDEEGQVIYPASVCWEANPDA